MSSILKALKKIDEESPPSQSFPSLPQTIDAKQAVNTKTKKRWFVRRSITAIVILLIVIAAAVIVISQRQLLITKLLPTESLETKKKITTSSLDKSKVFKAKMPPTSTKSSAKLLTQKRQTKKNTKPATPGSKEKKYRTDVKVSPDTQDTRPKAVTKNKKSIKKDSTLGKATASKKSIAGKRALLKKSATGTKETSPPKAYDRIDDSKLKLQALAWFSDASRRMVVINGRIIREGESVEGFQITQIRREDVVVNDGRKSWSLEFRLKQ